MTTDPRNIEHEVGQQLQPLLNIHLDTSDEADTAAVFDYAAELGRAVTELTAFRINGKPFMGDDSCDDLRSCLDALSICVTALTSYERDQACHALMESVRTDNPELIADHDLFADNELFATHSPWFDSWHDLAADCPRPPQLPEDTRD